MGTLNEIKRHTKTEIRMWALSEISSHCQLLTLLHQVAEWELESTSHVPKKLHFRYVVQGRTPVIDANAVQEQSVETEIKSRKDLK